MAERVRPVKPPKVDPFSDVPVFDPGAPDNPPPPPGTPDSTALTKPTGPADAEACRERMRELAREIVGATPARKRQILDEVLSLRVAMQLFNEADSGAIDPDTYRELGALNRSLAGEDGLDDDPNSDEARQEAAELALRARGVDPARARRLLRTLESLNAAREPEHDEPGRRHPAR